MNDRMKIMFLAAVLVLVVGLFGLIRKIQLPTKASLIVKKAFTFTYFLIIVTFILSLFGIYFRGYWTTKIILWAFILIASLFYSFGNRQIVTRPWKIASGPVFYFPLVSILLVIVPTFFGTVLSYATWLRLAGDPKAIYYDDNEVRIQKVCSDCDAAFMGDPKYFKKKGIFEFDMGYLRNNTSNTFEDKIMVEKTNDSVIVYVYYPNLERASFRFKR